MGSAGSLENKFFVIKIHQPRIRAGARGPASGANTGYPARRTRAEHESHLPLSPEAAAHWNRPNVGCAETALLDFKVTQPSEESAA
ncbi:hypothetical protein T10_9855 [Trichinella papuae]|uniref:Uncharacterized protein n=1 Tax=Trichinella papuae TaxID=268474 RepID=A0A0V1MBD6_9BILA|nr:hypothetical protein T10_9855 [Trichinella papuae]